MDLYKHFIRLDSKAFVIRAFSSAFEFQQAGDICVNEQGERQYNPIIWDMSGAPIFKYENGVMRETTAAEKTAYIASLPKAPPTLEERVKAAEDALLTLTLG